MRTDILDVKQIMQIIQSINFEIRQIKKNQPTLGKTLQLLFYQFTLALPD